MTNRYRTCGLPAIVCAVAAVAAIIVVSTNVPAQANGLVVTRGVAALTPASNGTPAFDVTLRGTIAVAGKAYIGTATATNVWEIQGAGTGTLSGTSGSDSISGSCPLIWYSLLAGPGPVTRQLDCSVSIDGSTSEYVSFQIVLASDPNTATGPKSGPFTAPIDPLVVPSVEHTVGYGTESEYVDQTTSSESFRIQLIGQVALGGATYRGVANGSFSIDFLTWDGSTIPAFTLSGTSPSGTFDATCSGRFGRAKPVVGDTDGERLLTCQASVNGGPLHSGTIDIANENAPTALFVSR